VLEHPAYSSDLAPSEFFLFPKIKKILKGRHFDDPDDIRSNTTAALKAIPQNQFQNCFEGWTRLWHRCIASQGEYFEGRSDKHQQDAHFVNNVFHLNYPRHVSNKYLFIIRGSSVQAAYSISTCIFMRSLVADTIRQYHSYCVSD